MIAHLLAAARHRYWRNPYAPRAAEINAERPATPNLEAIMDAAPKAAQKRSQPPAARDLPDGIPLDQWDKQVARDLDEHEQANRTALRGMSEDAVLERLADLTKQYNDPLRAAQLLFGGPR